VRSRPAASLGKTCRARAYEPPVLALKSLNFMAFLHRGAKVASSSAQEPRQPLTARLSRSTFAYRRSAKTAARHRPSSRGRCHFTFHFNEFRHGAAIA
jgi:hypothetical protein